MAKILVVDDYPPVLDVIKILLPARGYQVVAAIDGAEGLRLCESHSFDLALLDVDMPGMDGIAVCDALKRHPGTRHMPVLMMTGRPGVEVDRRAKLAGAIEVIPKPFEVADLLAKLALILTPPAVVPTGGGQQDASCCAAVPE